MKSTANIDSFELLEPGDVDTFEAVGQGRKLLSRIVIQISNWFQHVILRSGLHYTQIDHHQESAKGSVFRGWRLGAFLSCILTGVSLCITAVFTIYVTRKYPPGADGIGVFATRTCKEVLSATTKIHLGINVLATMLVAASNYNMQCMTAPSRSDIDCAHQQGKWLDVGIQSVRNLRYVPRWKAVLWLALLLSTLPLHLLWNSAVFSITTSNRYAVLVVNSDLLKSNSTNSGLDCTNFEIYQKEHPENYATCRLLDAVRSGSGLETLTPERCIQRYANRLESDSSNVIAIARNKVDVQSSTFSPTNASLPVLAYFDSMSYSPTLQSSCVDSCSNWCTPWKNQQPWNCTSYCSSTTDVYGKPYNASKVTDACARYAVGNSSVSWRPADLAGNSDWICEPDYVYQSSCSVAAAKRNATEWTILPERYEIDHCLSSRGELTCKLQYSSVILYIATACSAVKFLAIALHLVYSREPILATVGDALASFLTNHDLNTKGKCLYTTNTSYSDRYGSQLHWEGFDEGHQPLKWERGPHYIERWHQGASWAQVFLCMLL